MLSSDEKELYVTTRSGVLSILKVTNGGIITNIFPTTNELGWEVTCTSSVAVTDNFFIYVLTDTPPPTISADRIVRYECFCCLLLFIQMNTR